MMPVGPLMIEHRLIERMVKLMAEELPKMEEKRGVNIGFLSEAIDFIRTYADRCHHGKEEDILFRDLAPKPLSPEHKKVMNELVEEHISARKMVSRLGVPPEVPYVEAHNTWVVNHPGTLLVIPVGDLAQHLLLEPLLHDAERPGPQG